MAECIMGVYQMNGKKREKLVSLCMEGMTTDGAHHKQWYLEEILKLLIGEKAFNGVFRDLEGEYGVEKGIPP